MAFDSNGDLFACQFYDGNIFKITASGTRSTFASGLVNPTGLAFDLSGNLFAATSAGLILEFTSAGVSSTFANDSQSLPNSLAFAPVPEPSAAILLAIGGLGLAVAAQSRRKRQAAQLQLGL
jgi:hypothetical protein